MIELVESYLINDKLFKTRQEAEDYKFSHLDDIKIGDIVNFNKEKSILLYSYDNNGVVHFIEDNIIYFHFGSMPKSWFGSKIEAGAKNFLFENCYYSWEIGIQSRKNLIRIKENFI